MNKTLVGIFNREMTDKELERLQAVAKDMNITPVEGREYDAVLWWLNITDSLPSGIEPSLYQFQEGRYMEMLYFFDAKLILAYELDEDALERLSDLKQNNEILTGIDDMLSSVINEIYAHESLMEELMGSEASLQGGRAFEIFYEHFHSDRDRIFEAAQAVFEEKRYIFDTSISHPDEPISEQSSVAK